MLNRVYDTKFHERFPTYKDVTICNEWLTFSNFKKWMKTQDWEGKVLDKDLLSGKYYSPETCKFVSEVVNLFISGGRKKANNLQTDVYYNKGSKLKPYKVLCGNPFSNKNEYVGCFTSEQEVCKAYKARKYELAVRLTNSEHVTDEAVKEKLLNKYKV